MRLLKASTHQLLEIDDEDDQLGSGGEGAVYQVGDDQVAKIYHKHDGERREKIEAMLQDPPEDNATRGHRSIAWPIDMLMNASRPSQFRGYLMPRVDTGLSLHQVAIFTTRLKERPYYTAHELHVIASNVASAFHALHEKGYVVGDVNDRNVMINERGLATLIDTDSFQVPKRRGSGWFRCRVGVAEFTPPELQQVKLSDIDRCEEHDLFGLGVLLFSLLMQGQHPFNGKMSQDWTLAKRIQQGNFPFGPTQHPIAKPPMAPSLDVLAPELRDMFLACFEQGARDPEARPRAGDWRAALNRARSDLKKCRTTPSHRFSRHLGQCPWCEIRDRITFKNGDGLDYFPPSRGQTPLQAPGGSSHKLKARSVSSGTSGTSATTSFASAGAKSGGVTTPSTWRPSQPSSPPPSLPRTAPPPSPSTSSSSSTPSVGQSIARTLLDLLFSGGGTGGSSGTGPPPGPPPPQIGPGRWQFQRATPIPPLEMGPILLGSDLYLDASGEFAGGGMIGSRGQRMPCQLNGRWHFDPYQNVLTFQTVINGMSAPQLDQLRIVGGGNGQYQLLHGTGLQFWAVRVS